MQEYYAYQGSEVQGVRRRIDVVARRAIWETTNGHESL